MYAGEVFRREAAVDVLTKAFSCEMVCLQSIYTIYCFVQKYFMVVYSHYVKWGGLSGVGCGKIIGYVSGRAFVRVGDSDGGFH